MIKKTVVLTFAMVILQCAMSDRAAAQAGDPCLHVTTWWFDAPVPFGFFYYASYPGTFVYLIAAQTGGKVKNPQPPPPYFACVPPQAHKETCPTCPSGGRPISFSTGDTYIKENDVSLPGLGGGLSLTRTWNSLWPSTQIASSIGIFGPNWRSTYEERIFVGSDNWLKYARGDGSYWSFGLNPATGTFICAAPANVSVTLSQSANNWVLTFGNGEQRQFNLTTGLLTAIIDRNGNTTQLTYDSFGRLSTVTDPASRHLYFNYPNNSSLLVTSVTSDFGLTLSYAYDTSNRLSTVTEPDLTTIAFTYNGSSQITQVTDSNGKVLESHTYDSFGHGLSSSQANGVNALTVTVPQ